MFSLLLHGGAGLLKRQEDIDAHREGIKNALEEGIGVFNREGSAVDAVEHAVMIMENNPSFNCGYGSVLDYKGNVQMDAAIMTSNLDAGGVVNATGIEHPIHVARLVMENTDHVLLGEPGLGDFLKRMNISHNSNMIAPNRQKEWVEIKKNFANEEYMHYDRNTSFFEGTSDSKPGGYHSTVGAVAFDDEGTLAAATSTGGIRMKMFGRIGDTPLFGCGTYADKYGAASATGIGEHIIKATLCRMAVLYMRDMDAEQAVEKAIGEARANGYECGLIGVDRKGSLGLDYTTESMSWASCTDKGITKVF